MKEHRVEVHWLDSGLQIHGWKTKEEVMDSRLSTVETIGYKVHEDEESIYVALTRDAANNHYYGVQVIAKKNIIKNKRLRER